MSKHKKHPKKTTSSPRRLFWIIGAIVLFIASGAATYFLLSTFLPHAETPIPTTARVTPVKELQKEVLTPNSVIARIKASYEGRYTLLNLDENDAPTNGELSVRIAKKSPLYQVEGMDFYNDTSSGASIDLVTFAPKTDTATPTASDTKLRTETASVLMSLKLEKTSPLGTYYESVHSDVYVGEGLICTIETPAAPVQSTSVRCGTIEDYTTAASTYEPFVTLVAEASPSATAETPITSDLKIRNSTSDGYKIASMNYFDTIATFYQAPAGGWTFVTATKGVLPCTFYDTQALRAAFKDEQCTDEEGNAAVVR